MAIEKLFLYFALIWLSCFQTQALPASSFATAPGAPGISNMPLWQREIADHLGRHDTTVSHILRKIR
jgi:hypothetical protein